MLPVSSRCPFGPSLVPERCCGGWAGGPGGQGTPEQCHCQDTKPAGQVWQSQLLVMSCFPATFCNCCIILQRCVSYFWNVFLILGRDCKSLLQPAQPLCCYTGTRNTEYWCSTRGLLVPEAVCDSEPPSLALWALSCPSHLTFCGDTGVPCCLHHAHTAAIPGSLPGTYCLLEGIRRENNHSATIFWTVTSDSRTRGMDTLNGFPSKSVHIHQRVVIFTICISDLPKELGGGTP